MEHENVTQHENVDAMFEHLHSVAGHDHTEARDVEQSAGTWARLVQQYATDEDKIEEFGAALVEIQKETSRRNAQFIRSRIGAVNDGGIWYASEAADCIDPDVES
jgi:hypothetical protein